MNHIQILLSNKKFWFLTTCLSVKLVFGKHTNKEKCMRVNVFVWFNSNKQLCPLRRDSAIFVTCNLGYIKLRKPFCSAEKTFFNVDTRHIECFFDQICWFATCCECVKIIYCRYGTKSKWEISTLAALFLAAFSVKQNLVFLYHC